jgi:hypothetical protein
MYSTQLPSRGGRSLTCWWMAESRRPGSKGGQPRLYQLSAKELKPMHDSVKTYERSYWTHLLGQIKQRAELKMAKQSPKQLTKREEGE